MKLINYISLKKCLFFIERIKKKHYKSGIILEISLWLLEPIGMTLLEIAKRKCK